MTWPLFDDAAQPDLQPIDAIIGAPRGFDAPTADALRRELPRIDTKPTTIRGADAAQNQLIELFAAHGHHAAAFLVVYHGITVAVLDAVERGHLGPRAFFDRPDGRFAERHFDGDVETALAALPPDFRAAVVLCDIEQLSYEEIAATLGVKLGTVRSRISRGRAMLRAALADRDSARTGVPPSEGSSS